MRRQDESTKATTFATAWTVTYHPQQVRPFGKSIDTNRLGRESMVHVMITGTSCVLQISSLDCLLPQNIGSESFSFFHIFISFPKMCLERIFQSLLPETEGEFIPMQDNTNSLKGRSQAMQWLCPEIFGRSKLQKGVVPGVRSRLPHHVFKEKAEKGINWKPIPSRIETPNRQLCPPTNYGDKEQERGKRERRLARKAPSTTTIKTD